MIATLMAPALAEAPVSTPLGTPPLPTVYEIAWTEGHSTGPFTGFDQAVEWALNRDAFLPTDEYFVDDEGRIYQVDADEGGLSKHYVAAIREVRS